MSNRSAASGRSPPRSCGCATLIEAKVTLVVMEATGDHRPFYYLLEDAPFELMLVNPVHAKNLPDRKTSRTPSGWPSWAHTG